MDVVDIGNTVVGYLLNTRERAEALRTGGNATFAGKGDPCGGRP
jgi:hypothetical protein